MRSSAQPITVLRNSADVTRRSLLKAAAGTAAALTVRPFAITKNASASERVIVRSIGGSVDEAARKTIWEPFTKATGIEVQAVPMTSAKLLAMAESKAMEVDVVHAGAIQTLTLQRKGVLDRIDYGAFRTTNPEEIDEALRDDYKIAVIAYSVVLGYSITSFGQGKHPKSWTEFWDVKAFPGPRTLADITIGLVDLEFALLADGVPINRLYPLNVDRAFKMLDAIRPSIRKFYGTGAIAEQLFASGEVVAGSVGNGRILSLMRKGAPVGIEWYQQARNYDYYSVVKGSPNRKNAERFIDFALSAERQADFATVSLWGPTNRRAFSLMKPDLVKLMASNPEHDPYSFDLDNGWWVDNREIVGQRWQQWLLR